MNNQNCCICNSSCVGPYFCLKTNGLIALKCRKCGHIFIKNSPINSNNASDFYTMNDFMGERKLQSKARYVNYYSDCFSDYKNRMDSSLVLKQFKDKVDYFSYKFPQNGRLLDVGCATGVFLNMMREHGWNVEGVEISDELASYARNTFSLVVHIKDLTMEKLVSEPFHVVTLFDVIEHIPDPNLMIAACKDLLAKDGILLIRTPTEEGLFRSIAKMIYRMSLTKIEFQMLWFYSFEHIHSFSLSTLAIILKKHGFSVLKVFREEESFERIKITGYVKAIMRSIGLVSLLLNKQHKITIMAKKC